MLRFRQVVVLLSLLCVVGVASARKAELVDPGPVAVPAGLSQEQVAKDVKRALIGRGWVVALEQPGHIESTLNLRTHVARIDIRYDTQQVKIAYVDSRDLDYKQKNGKRWIHPNYLSWVDNIVKDMSTNMQLTAMDK